MNLSDLFLFYGEAYEMAAHKGAKYHGTEDVLYAFRQSSNLTKVPIPQILLVRCLEKLLRISTMYSEGVDDLSESMMDNAQDLANYTAFLYGALKEEHETEQS